MNLPRYILEIQDGIIGCRKKYGFLQLRPGVRNEAFYKYGGLSGVMKTAHHKLFNQLIDELVTEYKIKFKSA